MIISILCLLLWLVAISITLLGTWYALKQFRTPPTHPEVPASLFPISILKPLKGVEAGMRENIESFFKIDYPEFEILFSIADPRDPVRSILEDAIARNPGIPAKLVIGDVEVGPNPKINNLVRSYELAKYDWILISDSNTRVDSQHLRRLVSHLGPGVGVVTAVVAGRRARGFGGRLEASYLNTFFARWTHVASALGKPFVIGKSMCFQKSAATRFGGLHKLGCYIAEDNMMGQAMQRLGLKVVIMRDPVQQFIGDHSFRAFWRRHVRWGRIRKSQAPVAFLLEPFVTSLGAGLVGAWGASRCLGVSFGDFLLAHLIIWAGCDMLMIRKLETKIELESLIAWFAREALALPLWFHMGCGNTVNWRGNRLKILPGGLVSWHQDAFAFAHAAQAGKATRYFPRTLTYSYVRERDQKTGDECIFFGAPQQVVIRSKVKTNLTTGGSGNSKGKSKGAFDRVKPPITGIASATT